MQYERFLSVQKATQAAKPEAKHDCSSPLLNLGASLGNLTTDVNPQLSPQLSQEPILDQASSSQITCPSPPPVIKETNRNPEGCPFQPVRFSDDTVAYVPIVRDNQGHANNKIYDHILRISSWGSGSSAYEIRLSQGLSLRTNVVNSLRLSAPVVIKYLDAPRDDFNLRFLISTYKIPAHTPVDIHGTLLS